MPSVVKVIKLLKTLRVILYPAKGVNLNIFVGVITMQGDGFAYLCFVVLQKGLKLEYMFDNNSGKVKDFKWRMIPKGSNS